MDNNTLKFKNTLWLLWLKTVLLRLIRIIHSTHSAVHVGSEVFESIANYSDTSH